MFLEYFCWSRQNGFVNHKRYDFIQFVKAENFQSDNHLYVHDIHYKQHFFYKLINIWSTRSHFLYWEWLLILSWAYCFQTGEGMLQVCRKLPYVIFLLW